MAGAPVRVFVSHHHSPDEDTFTARLVADLEAAGADVWVDTSGIPSGSFVAKISEGLEGRQWLVLVMTPAALHSPWVRAEVEAALQEVHGGRMLGVIPIQPQPCEVRDIPILWRTLHRYDATHDYTTSCGGLLRALGLAAPAVVGTQPAPPPTTSAQPSIRATPFPTRLAQLGYKRQVVNFVEVVGGVEVILPPLCDVPTGEFLMGSDPKKDGNAYDSEKPQHRVTLAGFQIARFPVTVAEYACFVRSVQEQPKPWQPQLAKLDHPVRAFRNPRFRHSRGSPRPPRCSLKGVSSNLKRR